MRQLAAAAALLILLSARSAGAAPPIAATYEFGALDEKTCAAFRRDAVPQSVNTAQFIDAHIEPVSAAEEVYLTAANSAFRLSPNPGRFSLLASRPAFSAWHLHASLNSPGFRGHFRTRKKQGGIAAGAYLACRSPGAESTAIDRLCRSARYRSVQAAANACSAPTIVFICQSPVVLSGQRTYLPFS
jgi:hypothetical protein